MRRRPWPKGGRKEEKEEEEEWGREGREGGRRSTAGKRNKKNQPLMKKMQIIDLHLIMDAKIDLYDYLEILS